MSETADTANPVENTGVEQPTTPGADEQPDTTVGNPAAAAKGRENSKLRERLRDATTRLETMQRREVERLAAEHLADPADLWRDGADLDGLLDDNGDVDPDKVNEASKELLAQHGHWGKPAPLLAPPASLVTSDGKIGIGDTRPSFEDAFRPRTS